MIRFFQFVLFLIFCQQWGFSQNFPSDRDKFVKTWQQSVSDDEAQHYLKDVLPKLIKGSTLNDTQFLKIQKFCNELQKKDVPIYPEIFDFLQASIGIYENKVSQDLANPWFNYVTQYAENNDDKLTSLLDFSVDFFRFGSLYKERDFTWSIRGGILHWVDGKNLYIDADQVDLICTQIGSNKHANDSIVIYKTSGKLDVIARRWKGDNGIISWEKAGLQREQTYAALSNYKADLKLAKLRADTVLLSTPYFSQPILGKLTDLTILDLSEGEKAPQFVSYERRLQIKELRPQMDYEGSFTLQGADFIGQGGREKAAKLIFKKDEKTLFEVSASGFQMTINQILARDASAVMRYDNGDSLSIKECFFTFDEKLQQLTLASIQRGSDLIPFVDSYYKMYCYAPILKWEKGSNYPFYTFDVGTGQQRKIARFESMNYFDRSLYQRFSGMGNRDPFSQFSQLVENSGRTIFSEGELASALQRTIDQIKPLLVDMGSAGFLISDGQSKKWQISPKLLAYAAAVKGRGDFDNISIQSDLRQTNEAAYAKIDLLKNELNFHHVEQIVLSPSQGVSIFPDTSVIAMYQNRDIGFSGWLKAGKCELKTAYAKFDYDNFLVNLLTTKTTHFKVNPLRKEDGSQQIDMVNDITGLRGILYIDEPENKGGNPSARTDFPILQSVAKSKILYSDKSILNGAYDSTRFYYEVDLFELDSLDNFDEQSFALNGSLFSAGIFPRIENPVRIMNDYSFGFITRAPEEGYPFYETNSRYKNQIYLSHNGLQGAGIISFIHTTAESKKLTFLPDSTIGLVNFWAPVQKTSTLYPLAKSQRAYMSFEPRLDRLRIASYGDEPLLLFEEELLLKGEILIDKKAMTGRGTMFYKEAQLSSELYTYTHEDIFSENAAFALRNRFSNYGENPLAIQSDEMKTHISFATRIGQFNSNGTKRIMFPANEYYCQMDKFTWFIDGESLDFKKNKGGETTFESGADLARNNFFSTNINQDSLQFKSLSAKYDLKTQLILCDAVEYVQVGDARIFPDSSRVRIQKAAVMDTLKNAQVLANYITKFHRFENADIQIGGRLNYTGKGNYPYYDRDSSKSIISMSSISYIQTKTVAIGQIEEKEEFRLSPEFAYFGKIQIDASQKGLLLEGSTKLTHPCSYNKSWMTFKDTINSEQIQIPIPAEPSDAIGRKLALGFLWRDTDRNDSLRIYPAFLSVLEGEEDPSLFSASGYLQYDQLNKRFEVGSKARLDGADSISNLLVLDVENCNLEGYGKITLGIQTSAIDIEYDGKISYEQTTKATRIAANARISIPIENAILADIIDQIKGQEGAPEYNIKKPLDGLYSSMIAWSNSKDAQDVFKDFDEEKLKRMPNTLSQTFIISGIVLESFGANKPNAAKQDKGLLSKAQQVGLISINGTAIAQPITFTQAFVQSLGQEGSPAFYWLMETFDGTRYVFQYTHQKKDGSFSIYSSNSKMMTNLEALKPDKRKAKNFIYQATEEQTASLILAKLRSLSLNK